MHSVHPASSPRTGAATAPVSLPTSSELTSITSRTPSLLGSQLSSSSFQSSQSGGQNLSISLPSSPRSPITRRRRLHSGEHTMSSPGTPGRASRKPILNASTAMANAQSRSAQKFNDSLVYLDGPQIYTCAQCRTHLTSHDEIISKSFHGRKGEF